MINAGRFQPDLRRTRRINEYGIFFSKMFYNPNNSVEKNFGDRLRPALRKVL